MSRTVNESDLLWTPSARRIEEAELTAFTRWLEGERKLKFATYEDLWRWSVSDLPAFWGAIWDYFEIEASTPYRTVLGKRTMPGAEGSHVWLTAGSYASGREPRTRRRPATARFRRGRENPGGGGAPIAGIPGSDGPARPARPR